MRIEMKSVDEPWDDKWAFRLIVDMFGIYRNKFNVEINEFSDSYIEMLEHAEMEPKWI